MDRAMASHVIVAPQRSLQRAYAKEKGFFDTNLATYGLDTTGTVTLLNPVPSGTGVEQRVGKKIIMKGLQCRGTLLNANNQVINDIAYMIVYDKRPTGALPAVTDILETANANALNNDANAGRFRILKRVDDVIIGNTTLTGAVANALTSATVKTCDWWLDLKSAPVVYKLAGTGAIGDIEEGALYLVTVGTVAAAASAVMNATFRMRFVDN